MKRSRWAAASIVGLGVCIVLFVGVMLGGIEVVEVLPSQWEPFCRMQMSYVVALCPFASMTLGIIGLVHDARKTLATISVLLHAFFLMALAGGVALLIS